MSIINCPICGVSFRANKQQKTCSMECRTKQTLARQLQRLEEFNKTDEQFCRFCNSMKKKIEFHKGKDTWNGLKYKCKQCSKTQHTQWRDKFPRKHKDALLRRFRGTTIDEFEKLFESQGKKCGICESYDPSSKMGWLLDHCHKSTKNRGILCLYCNSGIGYFRDNIEIMQKAIEYIRKYQ